MYEEMLNATEKRVRKQNEDSADKIEALKREIQEATE